MAITIGSGITISGGIELDAPAGGGGGSGGGTEVTVVGFWGTGAQWGPPDPYLLTMVVDGSNTAGLADMDALGAGASLTLTDTSTTPTTFDVTINGSLNKLGPFGPSNAYQYSGNTVEANPSPGVSYQNITSVTITDVGDGGPAYMFEVGDGKTVSVDTTSGAAAKVVVVTNGQRSALTSWTSPKSATLAGAGGPVSVTFDYVNNTNDNGDGTWTYEIAIYEWPSIQSWDSVTLEF